MPARPLIRKTNETAIFNFNDNVSVKNSSSEAGTVKVHTKKNFSTGTHNTFSVA